MFRIAICDDLSSEREIIRNKVDSFFQKANLSYSIDEFASGKLLEGEFSHGADHFDLVLMDIFMDDGNGYESAKTIRRYNRFVPIAFLTSSRDYAIESYDVEAAGYLVKPIEDEKFFSLLSKLTRTETPRCLTITKGGHTRNFDYREIVYIESHAHTITLHLSQGDEVSAYTKLDALELDDPRFLRCHKSYIVNMDYVRYAEDDFHLSIGGTVPIRTRGRKEICDAYTNYFIKKHMGGEVR